MAHQHMFLDGYISANQRFFLHYWVRCSHWVHSRCSGLRNAVDYRKANGWICTACMTPPQPTPTHTLTMLDKTFNILQWNANGIDNKLTELSILLEAHNVKVASIQELKLTTKSRSTIQNYTLVRPDRCQGPGGDFCFFLFITQSASLQCHCQQRRRMTPHLEELTISIAMEKYRVAHYQCVHAPSQFLQWALFTANRPLADRHRFISPRILRRSPFTLALRNNRYQRQSTGGFG